MSIYSKERKKKKKKKTTSRRSSYSIKNLLDFNQRINETKRT